MKHSHSIYKSFFFLANILFLLTCARNDNTKAHYAPDNAIKIATDYMVRATDAQGIFLYRVNMNPEISISPSYNMLRHAGAIYAMCTAYEKNPAAELKNAILRSGSFLRDSTIRSLPDEPNIMAVWSDPKFVGGHKPIQAKLGGTGLGLIALTGIEHVQPGFISPATLESLGNFIVYSQKADGSYYSKFILSEGGRMDNWTSLYYPGEAALGLMMLYEIDENDQWLHAAAKTIGFLATSRKGQVIVPADHWALMATEKLMALPPEDIPVSKDVLFSHAIQVCTSILAMQILDSTRGDYYGGFNIEGRVTPTSTRLEGLIAARSFIPKSHPVSDRLDSAISLGIQFLLNAQIKDGFYSGGFPRAVDFMNNTHSKAKRFNDRVSEIRIDYVQHALSAMIKYRDYQ